MRISIYTDGGCHGNPGPGGWAYVILDESTRIVAEKSGGERNTTNNRMELLAVINALEAVVAMSADGYADDVVVDSVVFTDSQYVRQGITSWIHTWKRNGWVTAAKTPVKNKDLWQRLDGFSLSVKWIWVRGHAGNIFNERCDAMTQSAITSLL
ncbi:MAG: ribonuclease HI [Treponema sp.]|jgi:ribonuclease HI|nr:ribonuclease HI [Treponema sp.]